MEEANSEIIDEGNLSVEDRIAELELKSREQDIEHREKYANRLFWFVAVWVGLMLIIVLLEGSELVPFDLSDTVLTTLIGATTANVLGLFAIVANYLFPKR